jgi:hypothetical protein
MNGTVAITDHGWYRFLLAQDNLDEVNFWTPVGSLGFWGRDRSAVLFQAEGAV